MQKTTKPGYVYILTNPSFRANRIKIGKSKKNVDVRSKQLFNTAIPTPFEIYATIKTTKFNEVETMLHSFIDLLTDTRVNQKREFFDILPEKALEIFKIIYPVVDDAFIEIYDKGDVVETIGTDTQKSSVQVTKFKEVKQPQSENKGVDIGLNGYYLCSNKCLATYFSAIKGVFVKDVLVEQNMPESIFDITSLDTLEELRQLVKVKEKALGVHNTYSCAISQYKHYLEKGMTYKEFQHDAEKVKNEITTKQWTTIKK